MDANFFYFYQIQRFRLGRQLEEIEIHGINFFHSVRYNLLGVAEEMKFEYKLGQDLPSLKSR